MRTLLLIIVSLHNSVLAKYQLQAHDCLRPQNLQRFQRSTMCEDQQGESTTTNWVVAQKAKTRSLQGFSCSLKYSEWIFKCGAWSHLKVGGVPKVLHHQEVSPTWCRELSSRRKFKLAGHLDSKMIYLDRVNVFPIITVGSLKEKADHIVCSGESLHFANEFHTNLVQLKEFHLTVSHEQFRTDGHRLESLSSHLQLPCKVEDRGCITGSQTFIYDPPAQSCPVQRIRNIRTKEVMKTYVLDEHKGILLNKTKRTRLSQCPFELVATQFDDLYLVEEQHGHLVPELKAEEVELDLALRMDEEYNAYMNEKMMATLSNERKQLFCGSLRQAEPHVTHHISGNRYAVTSGDIIYAFECPEVTVEIREMDKCFSDVPIKGEPLRFVDLNTRVIKLHSPEIPCSAHFPTTILTKQGWIEITKHIKRAKQPLPYPKDQDHSSHGDHSHSGLYTEKEMRSWESLISLPVYQKALLSEISLGVCLNADSLCTSSETDAQRYDLSRMFPSPMEEINLWTKMKSLVRLYGDEMALFVIIYVIFKLTIDLVLIASTLYSEGPGAMVALIVSLYLSNQHQYMKIRRRNKKLKQRREKESKDVPMEMHSVEDKS